MERNLIFTVRLVTHIVSDTCSNKSNSDDKSNSDEADLVVAELYSSLLGDDSDLFHFPKLQVSKQLC